PGVIGAGVHPAHFVRVGIGHQLHRQVTVHGHQHGRLARFDHRVFTSDVQLARRAGGDHAPASLGWARGAGQVAETRGAPGPAPTTRTWAEPATPFSSAATVSACPGWTSTATFGPASAVA